MKVKLFNSSSPRKRSFSGSLSGAFFVFQNNNDKQQVLKGTSSQVHHDGKKQIQRQRATENSKHGFLIKIFRTTWAEHKRQIKTRE
jgi:hypothetical protein